MRCIFIFLCKILVNDVVSDLCIEIVVFGCLVLVIFLNVCIYIG